MNLPDIVAICASSPDQAATFSAAIARRQEAEIYPRELEFVVVHDPPAGRVGSGGGTLHALSQLPDDRSILLIHAGGESRRLPAWAPEGKLFAPVPVPSSTVQPPVLLDIQLGLYLRYPWRPGELVVASGDVYLDFDVASVRADRGEVCGFAVPASCEEGSRHGVFVFDRLQQGVTGYLQKAPVGELRTRAALPGGNQCALDIGIVAFDRRGRQRLRTLAGHFGDSVSRGEVYIDLYVEILTAALDGISDEEYHRLVAGQSRMTAEDRGAVREIMRGSALQGVLGRRSTFLHYGSIGEVPETAAALAGSGEIVPFYDVPVAAGLVHELRPGVSGGTVTCDCEDVAVGTGPVHVGQPSLVEHCGDFRAQLTGGTLVTGVDHLHLPVPVPFGLCLDGRTDHGVIAVYGSGDTFKPDGEEPRICSTPLPEWLENRRFTPGALGIAPEVATSGDIWELPLWVPLPDDASPAARGRLIAAYWDASLADDRWRQWILVGPRRTLRDLTDSADLTVREASRAARRARLLRASVLEGRGWQSIPAAEARAVFAPGDRAALSDLTTAEPDELIRSYRGRFIAQLGSTGRTAAQRGTIPTAGEPAESASSIQIPYLSSLTTPPALRRSVKPDQIVWARSPVRMDFGGGWTDTPPYTLREGGRVCNVAIDLNGQSPIQVFCRPLAEPEIRFRSIDLGEGERVTTFAALEDYRNPLIPFALPRAALCILGFTQRRHPGRTLAEVLGTLGGGVEVTLLAAVPKGSGLGTSSILGAVLLAALERFFGVFDESHINTGELYRQVLQMEQMLTTGGGWQDQIGGVAGGVKYAVSPPGLRPDLAVYQLDPWLFEAPEAVGRYTLFYTGATRLARNILEEVVDGHNSMNPASLFTVRRIGSLADAAREAFALRDIERFAWVVRESWKENRLIHPSTTNAEIDAMLAADGVAGNYQAMKLLGAGGGGYAFFVSADAESARRLQDGLEAWAARRAGQGGGSEEAGSRGAGATGARVVELSLNRAGLQVTVS
jgi:galactokinase/mevalonate kinase-like predicted kinase